MLEQVVKTASDGDDASETEFVEAALRKFCKLLQVAFGEAGAGVIAKNLKVKDVHTCLHTCTRACIHVCAHVRACTWQFAKAVCKGSLQRQFAKELKGQQSPCHMPTHMSTCMSRHLFTRMSIHLTIQMRAHTCSLQ